MMTLAVQQLLGVSKEGETDQRMAPTPRARGTQNNEQVSFQDLKGKCGPRESQSLIVAGVVSEKAEEREGCV